MVAWVVVMGDAVERKIMALANRRRFWYNVFGVYREVGKNFYDFLLR